LRSKEGQPPILEGGAPPADNLPNSFVQLRAQRRIAKLWTADRYAHERIPLTVLPAQCVVQANPYDPYPPCLRAEPTLP
jgi:hypothetical protein